MKLFLLDAYALIYRAYYALIRTPRINSKGMNTSAIFGFVNTLEEVLKKENPTHIGVAFDPPGPTFRHEAFDAYKAKRNETPEAIRESVPIIKDIIRAYRIPILEVPYYEADDVIGTLAKKAPADCEVYMMTPDKDYGQLVDTHIFIYRPRYGKAEYEILGIPEIKEKYSLSDPLQMIDLLGLMGDASDNIPGCPGIGEVTAKKLIAKYGGIDNLLAKTGQLRDSIQRKIVGNKDLILFSKFLATIKIDVPIEFNPEELEREAIDEPALRNIFEYLEFRSLSDRVLGEPKKNPVQVQHQPLQGSLFDEVEMNPDAYFPNTTSGKTFESSNPLDRIKTVPHDYSLLDTNEKIADLIERIKVHQFFSFDTETTGLDPLQSELVGMSFALEEGEAYFVSIPADQQEAQKKVRLFKKILEDKTILKIGQGIKYDMNVLKKYGVFLDGPIFDTLIAHYLINPEQQHNMDYLAETYLHYRTIHIEELIGSKGKNQLKMSQVPIRLLVDYACEDADITLKLKNVFSPIIEKEGLNDLLYNIELPLIPVLSDMEEAGVRLDIPALKECSIVLTEQLWAVERRIFELAGMEFNLSSPKAVGEVLFDRLKIVENAKKTKLGQYLTGEDVLQSIKSKHPIVEQILEYRRLKKLLSTYVDALPSLISPLDGKVHTTYNQTIVATGRLSSTNPNLQNIPIKDEDGREIRKAFIPDEGCLFLSVDYSQIELRIMAHLSEDKNLVEAFLQGQDIHTATAAKIFDLPINEVTPGMRRKAKTANFGIIYGISSFGLAEQLRIPRTDAKDLIDGYFATFPGVKEYIDRSIEIAHEQGYVETIFHRKRFLPDINSRNAVVRGYAERNAINAPIQGSAADIIKVAMDCIYRRFKENKLRSRMIMQVHDELNFNVRKDELDIVKKIVVAEMENAVHLKVPLVAECGIGKNWLEAH
ncbi:DNA polymerase I [Bacteroidia bacterium]|nr:DNA polymerase I [Bacteroidia bacterium]